MDAGLKPHQGPYQGRVKWFNGEYGFITPVNGGVEVLVNRVHVEASGLATLLEGALVEYWVQHNRQTYAADIRILADAPRYSGKVKWYSPEKGYGFIIPDGGGYDVFVHVVDVEKSSFDTLLLGQPITYRIETRRGKFCAADLR